MKQRILAIFLSLTMMFTLVPTAWAEGTESGVWTQVTLSESGKLEDAVKAVNPDFDAITKLKVTTSGNAVLTPADFQFLSGVVVTETEDDRYRSEYPVSGTTYLQSLTELDLSGARCENNAIPPRAFQKNATIKKIILPDTLERTYLHAFSMMNSLTYLGTEEGNLTFPSSMKTMGEGMVWEDKNLTGSLTLPASLEAIGSGCFCGSGITGKVVIPGNVKIAVNTDMENGSCGPAKLIFSKTNISSLIFENGITEISESFAKGCESLTSVTIPASVKTIGEYAFYGTSLAAYPAMEGVTKVGDSAFRDLKNAITGDIELKNGVSYGGRVFFGDTINGNVTVNSNSVGDNVFDSAKITGDLTINSKTVPLGAIHDSTITGNVTVNSSSIDANAFKNVAINGDLTINSETVPARLLSQSKTDYDSGKARITGTGNVTLGDGVKEVGANAFGYAGIPGTLTLPEGLVKIGGSAFRKNKLHGNIVIPESVTEIGGAAFSFAGNKENVLNFIVESANPASTLSQYAFANQAVDTKIYFMAAVTNSNQYWSGSEVTILNTDGGYVDTTKVDSTTGLFTPSKAGYSFLGWFDGDTKLENAAAVSKTYTAKWVARQLSSIEVAAKNANVPYGTILSADDFTVTAVYDNGERETVTADTLSGLGTKLTTLGAMTVTATYQGKTATCDITVVKAAPTVKITADQTSLTGSGTVKLTVTGAPTTEGTVTVTCGKNTYTPSLENGKYVVTVDLPNETKDYDFTASYMAAEDGNYENAQSNACKVSVARRSSSGGSSSSGSSYAVSVPSAKNGDVTVSPKNASKGDRVTVTVKPDSGYEIGSVTVLDSKGNELKLTDKGDGKYTFTMPGGKVEVKATFVKAGETSPFVDVPADSYYFDAVKWAQKLGITNGKTDALFGSNDPCTRGQIVTFLWRAAGSPEPKGAASGMSDVVSGSYYEKAVAWAIENGITTGTTASTFSPDATCTRAQAVTFLARVLNAKTAGKAEFSDVPADSYFADAVAWAAANGVTEGIGGGMFAPDNDCTRGQIVTFLFRAYNK